MNHGSYFPTIVAKALDPFALSRDDPDAQLFRLFDAVVVS